MDGDWKGLVYKYFDEGKSPEECAKAINDTGANESFESAQAGGEIVYKYEVTGFNRGALDYAELKDDKGNVTLLKFYKNKYSDDFQLESYDGETQKTLAAGGLRHVVDRYGELLDMEPADAILEIANES